MKTPPGFRQKQGRPGYELRFRLPPKVAQFMGKKTEVEKIHATERKAAIQKGWQLHASLTAKFNTLLQRLEANRLSEADLEFLYEHHKAHLLAAHEEWAVSEDRDDPMTGIGSWIEDTDADARARLSGKQTTEVDDEAYDAASDLLTSLGYRPALSQKYDDYLHNCVDELRRDVLTDKTRLEQIDRWLTLADIPLYRDPPSDQEPELPLPGLPKEEILKAARELARAQRDAIKLIKLREDGEDAETPDLPTAPRETTSPIVQNPNIISPPDTIEKLIERWKQNNAPAPKTVLMTTATLRGVMTLAQLDNPLDLKKEHVSAWRQARQLGTNGIRLVKAKTIEKDLDLLSAVFNLVVLDGLLAENPAKIARPKSKPQGRHAPTTEPTERGLTEKELIQLFRSPIWSNGFRGEGGRGEAQFWLPILELYAGARIDELAHLRIEDIKHFKQHNCYAVHTRDGRGAKIAGGDIPIHPDLIDMGFLDYFEHVKATGATWLFPDLPETWSPERSRSASFIQYWGRYKSKIHLKIAKSHNFRHTFIDITRQCRMPEEYAKAISGHLEGDPKAAHAKYGTDGAGFGPMKDDYFAYFKVPASIKELIPRWTPALAQPTGRTTKRGKSK